MTRMLDSEAVNILRSFFQSFFVKRCSIKGAVETKSGILFSYCEHKACKTVEHVEEKHLTGTCVIFTSSVHIRESFLELKRVSVSGVTFFLLRNL